MSRRDICTKVSASPGTTGRRGILGCPATSRISRTRRFPAATAASTATPRSWLSPSSSLPSTSTVARRTRPSGSGNGAPATRA